MPLTILQCLERPPPPRGPNIPALRLGMAALRRGNVSQQHVSGRAQVSGQSSWIPTRPWSQIILLCIPRLTSPWRRDLSEPRFPDKGARVSHPHFAGSL